MYAFLFEQYYQHHLVVVQELHTLGAYRNTSNVWGACLKRGKENQNCKKNQNRPRQKRLVKDALLLKADLVFFSSSELPNLDFDACPSSIPNYATYWVMLMVIETSLKKPKW